MNKNLVILAGGISSRMKKSKPSKDIDSQMVKNAKSITKSMLKIDSSSKPFLDYLLYNIRESGYKDIVIVVGEHDDSILKFYGNKKKGNLYKGISISYATQIIPNGRIKPLGTADALLQALYFRTDWKGNKFTVCNSDNLYSKKALKIMLESQYPNSMIDYDLEGLRFKQKRIEKFSVLKKDEDNFLLEIIEKPTPKEVTEARDKDGRIGVSMNIFQFSYEMILPYLETIPMHPVRLEKDLPLAVNLMVKDNPKFMYTFPISEHVPDLTSLDDIHAVREYLEKEFKDINL